MNPKDWSVKVLPTKYPDIKEYEIIEPNPDAGKSGVCYAGSHFAVCIVDSEEDAHLIAASPRLYQQLVRANELIKWLDAKYRLSQDIDTSDNIDLVVTGNKEALAKVEGREE